MYSLSAADTATVNPNGMKILLVNGLITFFINGNLVFYNGPRSLSRYPPNYIILDNWFFDILISVGELFAKVSQRFGTSLLVNNSSYGKLDSSLELPITFDDNLKTPSVSFFIADFDLLNYEFDSFIFKLLHWVFLY